MPSPSAKRQAQDLFLPYEKHPRIELSQQSGVNAGYKNDEASTSANKADRICRGCQKIDFEAIFSKDRRDRRLYKIWGSWRFYLSHMNQQSDCALCQFFHNVREPPLDENVVDPVYCLRIFPAKNMLGAWGLDFDNSPVFIVVPILDNYRYDFTDTHGIIMELSETPENLCGRQIQPQVDLSIIKGWLEFCDNNHKALCKQKSNPEVPKDFRVIDCVTHKIVPWENITDPKQYVTLSYVWGSSKEEFVIQEGAIPVILLERGLFGAPGWIEAWCGFGLELLIGGLE